MDTARDIRFVKMNGLGNDFVVFDARACVIELSAEAVRRIAERDGGIGCDQVIRLEPSGEADVFMRIWNADGGEVDACGNATRCIAWGLMEESGRDRATVATNVGVLDCAPGPAPMTVAVDMGPPRLAWDEIPLAEPFADTRMIELHVGPADAPQLSSPSVVNVGNPHCIFWVDNIEAHDLARLGPFLENHPLFPERANISLARLTGPDALTLRVWERGAGLTRACGTAACAAAVAAHRKRLTGRRVAVTLPGGMLDIEWRADDHVVMTGPVELDYEAVLPAHLMADAAEAGR